MNSFFSWINRNRIMVGIALLVLIIVAVVLVLVLGGNKPDTVDPSQSTSSGSDIIDNEADALPQLVAPKAGDSVAVIETDRGNLVFQLYKDQAPASVANFIAMAESGAYEGLLFSPVGEGSFLEIGEPESGGTYANETGSDSPSLFNLYGALGVAQDENGRPTNRFTVITAPKPDAATMRTITDSGMWPEGILSLYSQKGGLPASDGRYTVFGQLIEGEDVLLAILSGEIPGEEGEEDAESSGSSGSSASSASSQSASSGSEAADGEEAEEYTVGKLTRVLKVTIQSYAG